MRARFWIAALAALGIGGGAALAQDSSAQNFSKGSQAALWGLQGEEKATFEAKVVDVLCELSGDCPADCGGGRRQLGLLRGADGKLVLANKNGQPIFTGAVIDLLPYCGRTVRVDGVLVGEDVAAKLYMVQRIKAEGADWVPANRFSKVWIEQHPDLVDKPGRWFNKDPRVTSRIEKEGRLGLGPEADKAFAAEWF